MMKVIKRDGKIVDFDKKKIKDAPKDKWVIKNTGLAYEIWNQGRMIKKFPAKKLAIEWIHSRFPTDKITEDWRWQFLTILTKGKQNR